MKKIVLTIVFLCVFSSLAEAQDEQIAEDRAGIYIGVSAAYGLTGLTDQPPLGTTVGASMYGDSTYFKSLMGLASPPPFAKRATVRMEYLLPEGISFGLSVGYADLPYSLIFEKNTAAFNLRFDGENQYLEIGADVNDYALRPFFFGGGITYGVVLHSDASIVEVYPSQSNSNASPLSTIDNPLAVHVNLGFVFDLSDRTTLSLYGAYSGDITPIYSAPFVLSPVTQGDLTINLGVSTKL